MSDHHQQQRAAELVYRNRYGNAAEETVQLTERGERLWPNAASIRASAPIPVSGAFAADRTRQLNEQAAAVNSLRHKRIERTR
ncbi:hypothetical protein [Nocardia sp. XZ_19_385]|uniref:hypothetical protein n=1 Tax=Nocardia sp. XZ_19_385 TaxID=2769488 RepID=UPI00188DE814|nr:hypothetical protein [Nocardia sp. XZ_19_385]